MSRTLRTIRPFACADRFYPADPARLARTVDGLLREVSLSEDEPPPLAAVVPHAGYRYSGPVAASAFRRVAARRGAVRRVLVLGPAHFAPLVGIALPGCDAFATPLGQLWVDQSACSLAATLPAVETSPDAHAAEHSIEVQLPFVQRTLGPDISLVPILVGTVEPHQVARLIEALWTDESTIVLVSTDLSHYHDHATARRLDQRTAEAIVRRDPTAIDDHAACGRHPLRGLLLALRQRDLQVRQLDLRTSADTAGNPANVVGYGAFGVYETRANNGRS